APAAGGAGVARRYAPPWRRGCALRAGAAGPSNGAWHCLADRGHGKGRACGASVAPQPQTLDRAHARKDHRHLSGWTEPPVDSVRTLDFDLPWQDPAPGKRDIVWSRRAYQAMLKGRPLRAKPGGNRSGVNVPWLITPMRGPLAASGLPS